MYKRQTLRWQRTVTAALQPVALTHVQFVLLASLWWLSDQSTSTAQPPSQRSIAAFADVDVMMTSQVLRTLEGRGLLTRAPDPADARVKRLRITTEGQRLAKRAITLVEEADSSFFNHIQPYTLLLDLLRTLGQEPAVATDPANARPDAPSDGPF